MQLSSATFYRGEQQDTDEYEGGKVRRREGERWVREGERRREEERVKAYTQPRQYYLMVTLTNAEGYSAGEKGNVIE